MKKFSELNNDNTNKSVLTSNNTDDFIKNLVNESLSVEDGNINGKEELVSTLVKMFNMNENKAVLKTLESVKMNSYQHLNIAWINESIDTQRSIINGENQELITESVDETLVATKKEEIKEELITEGKEEKCECEKCECEDGACKCKPEDEEEKTDVENEEEETEVNETTQSIVNKISWVNRNDVIAYVESAGYALYNNETEEELRAILLEAVQNGEVELNDINESFVTKEKYVVNRENENLFNIYESIVNESDNTETENDTELSFKSFKEMFGAQMNQFTNEGIIFNYFGEELNYVEQKIFENKVASIIEKDGTKTLVSGFETEDRVGYIVTEQPIEESLNINLKR